MYNYQPSTQKRSAIIRNISDNKTFEAELISNKELIREETTVMKAYRENLELTNPIYKQNQEYIKLLEKVLWTNQNNAFISLLI